MTTRRYLPLFLRALCAAALVGLLVFGVDWHSLPDQFSHVSWPAAFLAIAGLTAHFVVSPWKWQQALRIHHLQFGFPISSARTGRASFSTISCQARLAAMHTGYSERCRRMGNGLVPYPRSSSKGSWASLH
jgi:hypothetical protein